MRSLFPLLPLIFALIGCRTSSNTSVVSFSPREPKNYLLVHEGKPADFARASCFRIEDATETGHVKIHRLIEENLHHYAPGILGCRGVEPFALVILYHAGRGVCVDCGGSPTDPQSGYAFLSLVDSTGKEHGAAEWQYWRGGTSEDMVRQFVFDLINLLVHGIEKFPR